MMRDYFEAEMRLLQEAGQEFARAYPEQAGMLNLLEVRDRDPYVERLLEGVAFLTAQVRQRIDDDVPELCEALLGQLWPHLLRPFPSATIAQFTPRPGQLQQPQRLSRGMGLLSPPVGEERTVCRFRTTSEVELLPLRIARVEAEEPARGGTLLRLSFQCEAGIAAEALELQRLKLYLHADPVVALKLHHLLTARVKNIGIRMAGTQPSASLQALGGQEKLVPCHLDREDMLVPGVGRSFQGFHLLQEYFCSREKYLFVSLEGLHKVKWPEGCHGFEIEIHLDGVLTREERIRRENFRLFCAPAVNLFSSTTEPVNLTRQRSDYPLVADAAAREGVRIYSVDEVVGISAASGRSHEYLPLHSFRHQRRGSRLYQVIRREGASERMETSLSVGGSSDGGRETLSCRITACNGDLPRRHLRENGLTLPAADAPGFASFVNLTRPGRMLNPPRRADYRLALVSHLSLSYTTLTEVDTLRSLLHLYDWSGSEQNCRRIEGVREVQARTVNRLQRGGVLRGLEIILTLQQDHYLCVGDAHLFGMVLHRFLSQFTSLNSFVRTRVILQPSHQEMTWEPLSGEHLPI